VRRRESYTTAAAIRSLVPLRRVMPAPNFIESPKVGSRELMTINEHEAGEVERANASGLAPVVFVHGLSLLPSSWQRWADLFEAAGYVAHRASGGVMTKAIAALGGSIQMPTPTATKPALHSRAALGNAPIESNVIEISGGGRTAVGDRRPAAKPAAPAVSPTPAPAAAKPAKMGCSGYRIKHGTSDEAIVKAIREHAAKSVAGTEDSPWIIATNLTDEQLLAIIGWSVLAKTACAKVAQHLSDMSG
jgi:hypothetical protein